MPATIPFTAPEEVMSRVDHAFENSEEALRVARRAERKLAELTRDDKAEPAKNDDDAKATPAKAEPKSDVENNAKTNAKANTDK